MRPEPDETEIRWLLTEASKYLSPQLKLRRTDVLSAWSGIRPLAADPHAKVNMH
jgi:glycerol-3-phosphate dehydrogenase